MPMEVLGLRQLPHVLLDVLADKVTHSVIVQPGHGRVEALGGPHEVLHAEDQDVTYLLAPLVGQRHAGQHALDHELGLHGDAGEGVRPPHGPVGVHAIVIVHVVDVAGQHQSQRVADDLHSAEVSVGQPPGPLHFAGSRVAVEQNPLADGGLAEDARPPEHEISAAGAGAQPHAEGLDLDLRQRVQQVGAGLVVRGEEPHGAFEIRQHGVSVVGIPAGYAAFATSAAPAALLFVATQAAAQAPEGPSRRLGVPILGQRILAGSPGL
mmetsp:Transcript_109830/g.328412  ORF Transcript_109830/g.328412 Transcript_109830/m.328412 type:complete len:266 (+) Transcript_109830:198-995(+)